jgi:hypothetical protein
MNNTISPFAPRRPANAVPAPGRYTSRQWDEVRRAFCSSILADTPLNSLAQNLEGVEWPLSGPGETPSAYLELEYEEMRERFALRGQPAAVADQLIDILKETLAFDNPFGEMVTQSETAATAENPLVKNLAKLKIPADFPVRLAALSPETLLFCQLESIVTLGEFAIAAQRMAGSVIVGGDFRALLNALSHVDERTLARYLPFRPGEKGLHYIEGLAQAVGAQPVEIQAALANRLMQPLPKAAQELAGTVSQNDILVAKAGLASHADGLKVYCKTEYDQIMTQIAGGVSPRQFTSVLGDPVLEAIVADLLKPVVQRVSLVSRLTSWLRK